MPVTYPSTSGGSAPPFRGFEPLTANYVYCPNQYFDVCLPHCSRGAVRLVAYVLRQTLGWLDKSGQPVEQNITVTYRELIEKAGISRGAIQGAVEEAIATGFIRRVQEGTAYARNRPAQSARYALRWDAGRDYVTDPSACRGFFAGEGYRTPIPNAFFDEIVPVQTLAVVKVVGAVLRHTVGYQNQFGGRRSSAPLSYSYLQRYVKIADRTTLAAAIRTVIDAGYIRCVEPGSFHSGTAQRRAAAYAVHWLTPAQIGQSGSKTRADIRIVKRFNNQIRSASKTRPAERFRNPTQERTEVNDTFKQQPARGRTPEKGTAAADQSEAVSLLCDAGFDEAAAMTLAAGEPLVEIRRQIEWIDARQPQRNRLGKLRRAIEQRWPEPEHLKRQRQCQSARQLQSKRDAELRSDETDHTARKRERTRRRELLLAKWQVLPPAEQRRLHEAAIRHAASDFVRRRLRGCGDLSHPPVETLAAFDRALQMPAGQKLS